MKFKQEAFRLIIIPIQIIKIFSKHFKINCHIIVIKDIIELNKLFEQK